MPLDSLFKELIFCNIKNMPGLGFACLWLPFFHQPHFLFCLLSWIKKPFEFVFLLCEGASQCNQVTSQSSPWQAKQIQFPVSLCKAFLPAFEAFVQTLSLPFLVLDSFCLFATFTFKSTSSRRTWNIPIPVMPTSHLVVKSFLCTSHQFTHHAPYKDKAPWAPANFLFLRIFIFSSMLLWPHTL